MSRDLPITIVEAMMAQISKRITLDLLQISHPSATMIRIVNDFRKVTHNGYDYLPVPFELVLPPSDTDKPPALQITIKDIDQSMIEFGRTVQGSRTTALGTFTMIDSERPNDSLLKFKNYELRNLEYDEFMMSFNLTVESFMTEVFGIHRMTPQKFKALF